MVQSTTCDLSIINHGAALLGGPLLLHDLVQLSSDTFAIDFLENGTKRRQFSYETLHSLSNALASRLTHISAKFKTPSRIIPVLIPQCPELYIVLLAVLKAGKAFCPLLLDTPTERLNFILQDISADFLITLSPHYETVRMKTELCTVLADCEFTGQHAREPRLPTASTHDLAYVLYTSGSTGLPKAVKVSHQAVTQSLLAHDRHIPSFSRFLQFAAPTFDVSIFEIFFPWFRGQTLVGCSRPQMLQDLPAQINDLGVDAVELTPTVVSSLLHGRSSVPGLKLLLTIGETLNQHVVDEFGGNNCKESILWAMYGPTEAAIHCTLQPRMTSKLPITSIGFPLDTVSAFILSPTGDCSPDDIRILPNGDIGELAIGGPQVADGYLNRSDLSTSVFVDHPDHGRIYRTGDRARICSDGCLEYMGRIAVGQIKLRGQRVELEEIEQVVMRIDGCRTATVMLIDDRLVAFCTVSSGMVTRSDVLEYCKVWLPSFMIPSDICFLSSLPQLPSGKIDRSQLETLYLSAPSTNDSSISETENGLDSIILATLRAFTKENFGSNTSLVSLGIDSLQSIRLASTLRREGFVLSAVEVITATTISDLVAVCKAGVDANGDESSKGTETSNGKHTSRSIRKSNGSNGTNHLIIPGDEETRNGLHISNNGHRSNDHHNSDYSDSIIFSPHIMQNQIQHISACTPLQEAMLVETSTRPGAYCNWIEVELSTPYTYAQICASLQLLCQANEILRTGFAPTISGTGSYLQIIWREFPSSRIRNVSEFCRTFSLSTDEALLHPLYIDIRMNMERPRVLFKPHHAIYDGWSFDLLLQDLGHYLRMKTVRPRPQFRDVSDYFAHQLHDGRFNESQDYWKRLLQDCVPTALPNYNGKVIHDTRLRRLSTQSRVAPHSLFQHARNLGFSPQVYFQAATAFILMRYSGSDDVMFGNVASGRTIPVTGVEDIMGPCIASLPCRIDFKDITRVQELLGVIQQLNRDSLEHSTCPLRDITKAAGLQPGTRLFDILFVWQQSMDYGSINVPNTAKIVDQADELEMKLTLEFEPHQDFISFRATYDPSLMPEPQIRYLSQQIDEVVLLFLSDTNRAIAAINRCFTTASLSIQNPNFTKTHIKFGPSHAVEEWASIYPEREAICLGHMTDGVLQPSETMTYAALNARGNQLAHALSKCITQEDQLIGIIMEKSVDLYVSILAVSKLGCGYLPLVPDTPTDRLYTILNDARITLCVSSSLELPMLPWKYPIQFVDVNSIDLNDYPARNPSIPYQGHHLAYAIFTSGSTGTPKGVLVTQENLMSNLHHLSSIYTCPTGSRLLQACSQAFDVSVFEIFFAWHVGMCLCTAIKDVLFYDFEESIRRLGITHLSLTPTVAALVDPKHVPRVQFLVTAGEALTESVRRKWAGRGLNQGYGPSETTNICTIRFSVTMDDLINNIGAPFANTSAFVLDPDGDSFFPRGAIGELCFGGTQVFRGYLNRPDLNAAKIINHPSYGRIYRSGDMGVILPDGAILSTGRSDDQVKIRGQRVELGEISSVALDGTEVQDCVTLLLPNHNNGKDLVSFWVPAESSSPGACQFLGSIDRKDAVSRLFASMSRKLPSYMVPSFLVPISRIPMTPQAKIDRKYLHSLFKGLTEDQLKQSAHPERIGEGLPCSEWEQSVASILSRTLSLPSSRIRRDSSFFNLGLDSVSAIRFANELRLALLGDFPISVILRNPTVAQLAAIKDAHISPENVVATPLIDLSRIFAPNTISAILSDFGKRGMQVAKILPCTPLQEAMLSSAEISSAPAYCNVMVFEVKGQVDRLQQCWLSMVQRHEILRTAFVPTNDPSHAFAQVVLADSTLEWLSFSAYENPESHIADTISHLLKHKEPPVRLALKREGTSINLLFGCHHALYDGSAITMLLQEVQSLYNGAKLPPPISYEIYLPHLLSQDLVEADRYWSNTLSGFEPSFFPKLTGRAVGLTEVVSSVTRCLQLPRSAARKACQDASVSLLSVIQTTWAKLLHFYTGDSDICFGNVVSGRSLSGVDLNRLVAPCFNTLPVRVNFDFRQTNSKLVHLTQSLNVDMLAFQLTPLRRIQANTLRDGGRLFDTLVILQQPTEPLDASIWTLEKDLGGMELPVVCEVVQHETRDVLELILHYNTSLLSETDAFSIAETFDHSFLSVLNSPQSSANDTVALPAHLLAKSQLMVPDSSSAASFLHSGFESVAAANPDWVALDFLHPDGSRTTWSFSTLNSRANDIAQVLMRKNIVPEDIIPLHLPKTPEFYAGILGILKAGAAFAPVHPDLPLARKELMLCDLKPRLILCSSDTLLHYDGVTSVTIESIERCSAKDPIIRDLRGSSLAYCLFTSGSTGTPKAVSMEHHAPIQTIESSRSLVPWSSSSRLLQYAAITFDMCYYDCFLAWTLGFTLCAAEQTDLLNDLPSVINALDISFLDLTPSVAVSLRRSEVPSVEWLYCIGESMSTEVVREWAGICVNSYGPTEAAFCTTIFPVSPEISTSIIGTPFPGVTFAIFPEGGDFTLPVLSTGELYIGGSQLARGYLDKPELTSGQFVHVHGQRFYKSGDIVRMLGDGRFEFIGRADDQVKIRGLRVELGDINHVLLSSCSDIKMVAAQMLKTSAKSKEQLVAFVVLKKSMGGDEQLEIRRQLRTMAIDRLPSYMVPQFFIFLEEIPRSMAGKIDKKALATIFQEQVDDYSVIDAISGRDQKHQWTQLEERLRGVMAQLSQYPSEDITPTTTIYQIGLDSISAVQIAVALRKEGHTITAAEIMKYMTCTDIAAYLNENAPKIPRSAARFDFEAFHRQHIQYVLQTCGIDDDDAIAIRPCTPLQKGMVSQFIAKEGSVYMNHLRLRLERHVDPLRLQRVWAATVDRHAMLRTGFASTQDAKHSFVMVMHAPDEDFHSWLDNSGASSDESIEDWMRQIQLTALNKMHRPPWALRIARDGGKEYLDVAMFHALFDAQSLQDILNDVVAEYSGRPLPPPIPLDPAIHGILSLSQECLEDGASFWTELGKKADSSRFPNLSPLRYDPLPARVCTIRSGKSLAELEEGCMSSNITLQAAGISSWLSLLSVYTGEASVTCGVVLSGRSFDAVQNVVFPCINTVPFACTIFKDRRETLDMVMSLNAQFQQYQFAPLNEIQKLMGYPSESLFDTIFAYQKLPREEESTDLWRVVDENSTTEYPVSIELEPKGQHLEYRLTFLPHIVPQEQALLILRQMDHLMDQFISQSPSVACEVDVESMLYSITLAKEPTLPSEAKLLHELVEHTAVKSPHRVALEFADSIHDGARSTERWTYAELDAEGNRIAHLLINNDVEPGSLVGVCFDKCAQASFAMLGVLKAGCAFVAIDPGAPPARQAFVIQDSGARAVLSMSGQSVKFRDQIDKPVLNLDKTKMGCLPSSKPTLERDVTPQDRSYCLYTSGTTGTPKGCELTHENAVQAMLSFQRLFAGHWDESSRWLQFASFHFDVSILEQFWSWSVGICVVSAPRDVIFEDLADSISALGITHIDLTPSLAQILHPDDVPSLCNGVFITGGESLKQEILDVWGSKAVIYNGYGPTEATIGCTMYPRVPANGKPSNIGRQFDNVGSLVLSPQSDDPVLRGGVGELCVTGKLVGKGYLNRPELTAERFPYLHRFGERVYRTGDLVRILHDGAFDFLGRADDQIKLRGQRLEVGEINSVMKQSSGEISDVATLVLKHPAQQKEQLVSFVVLGRQSQHEAEILFNDDAGLTNAKEACHVMLPPYMIPTHFISLSKMPLNTNNKADGKRLTQLFENMSISDLHNLSSISTEKLESWTNSDQKIRRVLSEILDVAQDSIGKDDSFFELGMDSISAIRVTRAMKDVGLSKVTASLIMKHSTIRRLSKIWEAKAFQHDHGPVLAAQQTIIATRHRHQRTVAQALLIDPTAIEALAPCTPLQQGMIARCIDSDSGLYFNTFQFRLSDKIHLERLREAWRTVFESTQILRTAFVTTEDGYVQAVIRDMPLSWSTHTGLTDEWISRTAEKIKQKWLLLNLPELKQTFELHVLTTPGEKLLLVHVFHGLYDGHSIELIFESVWQAYNQQVSIDYSHSFQSALAYGPLRVVAGAEEFWKRHFATTSSGPFPSLTDGPREKSITITRRLEGLAGLNHVSRRLKVTAQAIALSCWLSVLRPHTKSVVTTGVVVSGRSIDLQGADRIIGPMFNTLPCQQRIERGDSWASIVKSVHDFNVSALPYQHTPLRDIMKWCKRGTARPLFNTLFVYHTSDAERSWSKNEAWEILDGDAVADYPLALEVSRISDDGLDLTLAAQGCILDAETANNLLDRFEHNLDQILVDPNGQVGAPDGRFEDSEEEDNESREALAENFKTEPSDYKWSDMALKIKEEISILSGVDQTLISETTSIFELGLDSIDAIKLSSKLKKLSIDLPVSGIMQGLTIARITENMTQGSAQKRKPSTQLRLDDQKRELRHCLEQSNMISANVEEVLPLTPLQEAMVAEMVASDYTRYYNFDVLRVNAGTDVDELRDAWSQVVQLSPILRTGFVTVGNPDIEHVFAQIIHKQPHDFWASIKIDHEPDFSGIFEQMRSDAMNTALSTPPVRILLVETPQQSFMVLAIAHALYDGRSIGLIHTDVERAYRNQLELRPSYEGFLADMTSMSENEAIGFWQNYLSDVKISTYPRRRRFANRTGSLVYRHEQVGSVSLADATTFARKNNVSLQIVGQAAFAMVLASYTKSLDVAFGSVLAGRDDDERAQLLFPTMNTVAVRTVLHGSCNDMLQYMQSNFLEIKTWQHIPLRKTLALAGVEGRLFESLFIYQKGVESLSPAGERLYSSVGGHSDVEYAVCVEMEAVGEQIVWRCAAKEDFFSDEGTKGILERINAVLEHMLQEPNSPVINVTEKGTSVCGLSAFEESIKSPGGEEPNINEEVKVIASDPQTIQTIRQILAQVSKMSEHDITDDMTIFHIGLDSISAIKVTSLLRRKGITLSVAEMLQAGSIEGMARIIAVRETETINGDKDDDGYRLTISQALQGVDETKILEQANISSHAVLEILPVAAGQLYMLSMWLNTKGSNFYPEFKYEVHGDISLSALKKSWQDVVAANPILRTVFARTSKDEAPYIQVVLRTTKSSVTDLTGENDNDMQSIVDAVTINQPWVHFFVCKKPESWHVRLKIHHALYDGVSLPTFMQQFQQTCNGGMPPSPTDAFARMLARNYTASAVRDRKTFWADYLGGGCVGTPSQPSSTGGSKTEVFRPALLCSSSMDATARTYGISTQALFLASYARLYARVLGKGTGDADVLIGIYLANRSLPVEQLASAAVPTVNLVPLRVASPLGRDVVSLATTVQSDLHAISAAARASVSLYEISTWTGIQLDTFVNFLTLPAEDDAAGEPPTGANLIRVRPGEQWHDPICRVVSQTGLEDSAVRSGLADQRINKAYLHAIDVEARVRNGALDVAIFAPTDTLSLAEGEAMMEAIKSELASLQESLRDTT